MTYFPGHGPDGHSYECQTTQRALISRWGLRFGILHAVFTVIVAYLCYGAELTNWRAWEPAGTYEARLARRRGKGKGRGYGRG